MKANRVVNISYMCEGLHFDAAIDCDFDMHPQIGCYRQNSNLVPVELYCFDHKDWDVAVVLYNGENDLQDDYQGIGKRIGSVQLHTFVDMDFILEETRKWIKQMED